MRPEQHHIDVDEYYARKSAEVEAGKDVWVENFDIDQEYLYRFTGFFRAKQMVALIKEARHQQVPPRYPVIYDMKSGRPVISRTALNFEEAEKIVRDLY